MLDFLRCGKGIIRILSHNQPETNCEPDVRRTARRRTWTACVSICRWRGRRRQQRYPSLSLPRRLGPTRMPVEECEAEWRSGLLCRRVGRSAPSSQFLRVLTCTLTSKLMDNINRGHLRELNTFPRKSGCFYPGKAVFHVACHFISRPGIFSLDGSSKRGRFRRTIVIFKNDR